MLKLGQGKEKNQVSGVVVNELNKDGIANKGQMVKQVHGWLIFLQRVLSSNPGYGGFFFNREKQLFAMNPGKDLNYHAETRISDTVGLNINGIIDLTDKGIGVK